MTAVGDQVFGKLAQEFAAPEVSSTRSQFRMSSEILFACQARGLIEEVMDRGEVY